MEYFNISLDSTVTRTNLKSISDGNLYKTTKYPIYIVCLLYNDTITVVLAEMNDNMVNVVTGVIVLDFILFNIYFLEWNLPFLTSSRMYCVPFPVMDWRTNLHICTNICGGPTVHTLVEFLLYTHW